MVSREKVRTRVASRETVGNKRDEQRDSGREGQGEKQHMKAVSRVTAGER